MYYSAFIFGVAVPGLECLLHPGRPNNSWRIYLKKHIVIEIFKK
jgi:hypothetical protein